VPTDCREEATKIWTFQKVPAADLAAITVGSAIPNRRHDCHRYSINCHCEERSDPRVKPEGMRGNLDPAW
jgi:hypothetical protein